MGTSFVENPASVFLSFPQRYLKRMLVNQKRKRAAYFVQVQTRLYAAICATANITLFIQITLE